MLLMLGLLASLIGIYIKLDIGRSLVPTAERWLVQVPFSIYLGWITVATIANATSLLDYLGWTRFGLSEQFWFVIVLTVAVIIVGLMTFARKDIAYLGVIIWAFVGIAVKFSDVPVIFPATVIATLIVVGYLVYSIMYWIRPKADQRPVTA
ncbi:MAG: hypothetical protein M9941_04335 [Anaerolineae bacterium]|nr:hypothetical protein [Anaerolineae bacterium]MCO5196964.1 hypothetical protein [Anaerolineae bacterium]